MRRSWVVQRKIVLLAAVTLLACAPGGAALQAAETPGPGMEFVQIPGGEFEMGSTGGAADASAAGGSRRRMAAPDRSASSRRCPGASCGSSCRRGLA